MKKPLSYRQRLALQLGAKQNQRPAKHFDHNGGEVNTSTKVRDPWAINHYR